MFSSLINLVVPLNLCIFLMVLGFVLCLIRFSAADCHLFLPAYYGTDLVAAGYLHRIWRHS